MSDKPYCIQVGQTPAFCVVKHCQVLPTFDLRSAAIPECPDVQRHALRCEPAACSMDATHA